MDDSRLEILEGRIARIEEALRTSAPFIAAVMDKGSKTAASVPPQSPGKSVPVREVKTQDSQPGNWLGIIAIICFVLAAGFIIKLSIDSGWLTPVRQIGMAALLGGGLITSGFALMRTDREYAGILPGAGIIILYLTTFAAHSYYSLISFETAIGLVALVSALCLWLYARIKHDLYVLCASAGAYMAPFVLGIDTDTLFTIYYFLVCSVTFAVVAVVLESRMLTLISAYLAILMTGAAGFGIQQAQAVSIVLALHFMLFSVSTYCYSRWHNKTLTKNEASAFLPILMLFYAVEYYYIDMIYPELAPWISLGFAGVLIGFYLSAVKYFPNGLESQFLIVAFASVVVFHAGYLELLPEDYRSLLFPIIILAMAFSAFRGEAGKSGAFYIPKLLVFLILAIEYCRMAMALFDSQSGPWILMSVAALASLWVFIVVPNTAKSKMGDGNIYLLLAAHLLAVLSLYRMTSDISSLAVSASWLFYAAAVMLFASSRKDELMAKSALLVLSFAAVKALLYDAASAPSIVRIFCLLLTGAALYGWGLLMRRIGKWPKAAG